jgi:hypothetical protein
MNADKEKNQLWKTYSILMGIMLGGAVVILVGQNIWNSIQQQSVQKNVQQTEVSTSSGLPTSAVSALTESQAVEIIHSWIQAKRQVFGPPFNKEIAASLTTGSLYYDIAKPGGSIDWMKNNNAYYLFGVQKVEPAGQFFVSGNQGAIAVKITEDRTLYVKNKIDRTQSKMDISTVRYELQFVEGKWKLADYK